MSYAPDLKFLILMSLALEAGSPFYAAVCATVRASPRGDDIHFIRVSMQIEFLIVGYWYLIQVPDKVPIARVADLPSLISVDKTFNLAGFLALAQFDECPFTFHGDPIVYGVTVHEDLFPHR